MNNQVRIILLCINWRADGEMNSQTKMMSTRLPLGLCLFPDATLQHSVPAPPKEAVILSCSVEDLK